MFECCKKERFFADDSDPALLRRAFIEHVSNFTLNSRWAISWLYPGHKLSHIVIGEMLPQGFIFGDPQTGLIVKDALTLANPFTATAISVIWVGDVVAQHEPGYTIEAGVYAKGAPENKNAAWVEADSKSGNVDMCMIG